MSFFQLRSKSLRYVHEEAVTTPTASISGTVEPSASEAEVVSGGQTIIITLANTTWVASGGTFDAIRQDIIDGLVSAQSEGTGWNAVVQAGQTVSGVARTSDTVVTITLDAFGTYDITANETITVTVPASAVVSAGAIVAAPTFQVLAAGAGVAIYDILMPFGILPFAR